MLEYNYHGITGVPPEELDKALQIWMYKCESSQVVREQVVHTTIEEASETEPPSPYTDLYRFILEFAKLHNMWTPKHREWRYRARFYALLFNAGRLSGLRAKAQ